MDRSYRRALICDDDPSIRRVIGGLLVDRGFVVVAEVDLAPDAVQVAGLTKPDVIVLDVALMGMTGIEAIPGLRDAAPGCVIIVFSAFDAVRVEALAAGADVVIEKTSPTDLDEALSLLAPA